jgi:hypothetical protein
MITYRLRDWLFSRQRYWGEPIPIIHWEDGTMTSVPIDELPLLLPKTKDIRPSGTGESPLANIHEWVHVVDPKTGKKGRRETNTMPQWAGSSWYYLRFIDPHNKDKIADQELQEYNEPTLLLASTGTYQKKLFHEGCTTADLIISLSESDQKLIHEMIYKVLKRGHDPLSILRDIEALLEKYNTRSYISGCTEFHLLTKSLKLKGIDSIKAIDPLSTIAQNFSQLIIKQAQVDLVTDCHQPSNPKSP